MIFEIGTVQPSQGGYAFRIRNQQFEPLFSVEFRTEADAEKARNAMEAALALAIRLDRFIKLSDEQARSLAELGL